MIQPSYFSKLGCLILTLGVLVSSGCRQRPTPVGNPSNTTNAPANTTASEMNLTPQDENSVDNQPRNTVTQPMEIIPAVTDEPEELSNERSKEASPEPQRLLILLAEGPLLLDILLWIDGQPHQQALAELVQHIVAEGDSNNDGISTWEELADNPNIKYGQYGNLSFEKPMERKRLIELYDTNRNQRVDESEVPRFVTRNRGSAQAFSVYRTSFSGKLSRTDSLLRKLLDQDLNGLLSRQEIEQASQTIFALDVDDDEIVLQQELMPASSMSESPRNSRRGLHPGVFLINEKTQWELVLFTLEQIYNYGSPLSAKKFDAASVFSQLDHNANQQVDLQEIKKMPELSNLDQLEIRLGELKEDQKRIHYVTSADTQVLKQQINVANQENQLALNFAQDRLMFDVQDSIAQGYSTQQIDFLFNQYDADKNQYLEEDEFPEAGNPLNLRFNAVDQDNDGKLYREEIETVLRTRNWSTRCQIRLQSVPQQDALFQVIDINEDGRLSAKEVTQIKSTLRKYDENQNGSIEFDELPASTALRIYRGEDNQNNIPAAPLSMNQSELSIDPNRPAWHWNMDYNKDGDISRREFLGTTQQFDQLDLNADGFISMEEVKE